LRAQVCRYEQASAEEGAPATLTGLFRFLEALPKDDWGKRTGLDQRAVRSEGDAVVVSTWHRAKGLEWPIVVLLDTSEPRARTAVGVSVASDAAELDVNDPLRDRWLRYWPNPFHVSQRNAPLLAKIAAHPASLEIDEQARREELRLLYVGWTRARDRLVLATRAARAGARLAAAPRPARRAAGERRGGVEWASLRDPRGARRAW
jgi:ATP-dependent helicase/nuclease subunit A